MPDDFQREEKSAFPVAFGIGIVVVLLLVGGVILATRFTRSKAPAAQPFAVRRRGTGGGSANSFSRTCKWRALRII